MTQRRAIIPPAMRKIHERFHYTPGWLIGSTLYTAGQLGRDADLNVIADPEAQFHQVFKNIGLILAEAGTSFGDVVELLTWFTRFPADLPLFQKVKDQYMKEPYPTWTSLGIHSLSMPGLLVEAKVTAILRS